MKVQVSRPLSALSIAATFAFAAFAASAQTAPTKGEDMMKGCDMMGGDMTRMTQMMSMMHEEAVPCRRSCRGAQGRSQDHRGANAGME
jgi:hypothetical protein